MATEHQCIENGWRHSLFPTNRIFSVSCILQRYSVFAIMAIEICFRSFVSTHFVRFFFVNNSTLRERCSTSEILCWNVKCTRSRALNILNSVDIIFSARWISNTRFWYFRAWPARTLTHSESHTSIPNARRKIQITSFFYFYMDFYLGRGSDQFIEKDDTFRTDCSIVL